MIYLLQDITYSRGEQLAYLGELTVIACLFFLAGFLLLTSKRPKDKDYKFYGWIFYFLGYMCIALMFLLIQFFK